MDLKLKEKIEKEGNEFVFEAMGMDCYIWRHARSGHLCGYVRLPEGTKLYSAQQYYSSDSELGLSDFEKAINNLEVHGGITFSGELEPQGLSSKQMTLVKKGRYFGFDCAHLGDLSPFYDDTFRVSEDEVYRDKEYVIEECKSLARQLKEIVDTYK